MVNFPEHRHFLLQCSRKTTRSDQITPACLPERDRRCVIAKRSRPVSLVPVTETAVFRVRIDRGRSACVWTINDPRRPPATPGYCRELLRRESSMDDARARQVHNRRQGRRSPAVSDRETTWYHTAPGGRRRLLSTHKRQRPNRPVGYDSIYPITRFRSAIATGPGDNSTAQRFHGVVESLEKSVQFQHNKKATPNPRCHNSESSDAAICIRFMENPLHFQKLKVLFT